MKEILRVLEILLVEYRSAVTDGEHVVPKGPQTTRTARVRDVRRTGLGLAVNRQVPACASGPLPTHSRGYGPSHY